MNLNSRLNVPLKLLFSIAMNCRRVLPKSRSQAFGLSSTKDCPRIERIYVINLARQPARWVNMQQELKQILDNSGAPIWNLTLRYPAVDARQILEEPQKDADIDPIYTLGDQLFVEPQPLALPTKLELDSPILMSRPEIAVARSHINIWRQVAASSQQYALILEDDVWFRHRFGPRLDLTWSEMEIEIGGESKFDILYLSYEEVRNGAPKTFLSRNVFRPARGLWHLSGYVISRQGAEKLLRLLPCRGPVDLWLNHQFDVLDVRATKRSIISQRRDLGSTNSYSIIPSLTKIGAITSESASLFHVRPIKQPVFAFGSRGSGLSSLAMALSMLGYRCCSDLQAIPGPEHQSLREGKHDRVFDAYVNIHSLEEEASRLSKQYPEAKFIFTTTEADDLHQAHSALLSVLNGADIAILCLNAANKWQVICEHLSCVPPVCPFPEIADRGKRQLLRPSAEMDETLGRKTPKRDKSPWIIEPRKCWQGIHSAPFERTAAVVTTPAEFSDHFESLNTTRWHARDDTFTDNLALFRPSNIELRPGLGASLTIRQESLGVREYSAASLSSRDKYLFGRFEAIIRASNVPGVVTGFFLHRDSPRQEIDIEITGNRPNRLLVNVFYNPGGDGARFDYGFRGAASNIELGFDASQSYHHFAIEWEPCEIRWFVDDHLVHRRVEWNPTPIPHLPMALHVNVWPTRSKELAGRLANRKLPAITNLRSITLDAHALTRNIMAIDAARPLERHSQICESDHQVLES